jgi:RNA polymerase-binding transcription factor DksA
VNEPTGDFVVFRRESIEEALRGVISLGDAWTILKSGLDGNDPSAQALYRQIRDELKGQWMDELKLTKSETINEDLMCENCGEEIPAGVRFVQLIDPDVDLCVGCALSAGWTVGP